MRPVVQDNSSRFISNMQQLQDSVSKYVSAIDQQVWTMTSYSIESLCCVQLITNTSAKYCNFVAELQVERVEVENLRAVGLRNKMAAMHEVRHQNWHGQ
jgi:hypothetical protein